MVRPQLIIMHSSHFFKCHLSRSKDDGRLTPCTHLFLVHAQNHGTHPNSRATLAVRKVTRNAVPKVITTLNAAHFLLLVSL